MTLVLQTSTARIESWLEPTDERSLEADVLDGLTRPFKELPPKHFYDARGSELFAQICALPEYYPTRTERSILTDQAGAIVAATGAGELVELGSGSSEKATILLDAMAAAGTLTRYVPVDVSESVVRDAAAQLGERYRDFSVHGVIGDFERHLDRLPPPAGPPRLIALLGGTIGNFPPGSRRRLLRRIGSLLRPEDRLLIGGDLVKDKSEIEAAYNDSRGVTAEFNRNVLHVVNRSLGADFDPESFRHVAFFDAQHEWIEMRLRATRACSVDIPAVDLRVSFAAGEEIRTEISAKFTRSRAEADLEAAALRLDGWLTDREQRFALMLAAPRTRVMAG